jgi:hypothetical protein
LRERREGEREGGEREREREGGERERGSEKPRPAEVGSCCLLR